MSGHLNSSGSNTDLHIGVVVALALGIIVSVAAIVEHRGAVTVSASALEIVRPTSRLAVQQPEKALAAI
jgi:hypothetical protein